MLPGNINEFPPGIKLRLSIKLAENSLSVLVTETEQNTLLHFRKWDAGSHSHPSSLFSEIIENDPLLSHSFSEFILISCLNPAVLIPNSHHSEKNKEVCFSFFEKNETSSETYDCRLGGHDIRVMFSLPQRFVQALKQRVGEFRCEHVYHRLSRIEEESGDAGGNGAVVDLSAGSFCFLGFNKGKLQLANTYSYAGHTDFLYFLMLAFTSSGLDPEKDRLLLGGEIDPESLLMKGIHKYIRHYRFADGSVKQSDAQDDIYPHFFMVFTA